MNTPFRIRIRVLALLVALAPLAQAQEAPKRPPSEPATAEPAAPAPTAGEKAKKELDEAVDALRDYSVQRRDEAVARARQATEALDQRIEVLQSRSQEGWARMSQATRTRSQKTMADLRTRRNQLAEWYGGMRHGSADAWDEVKNGFVTSYHDLADAMRKARRQFDQAQPPAEAQGDKTAKDQE